MKVEIYRQNLIKAKKRNQKLKDALEQLETRLNDLEQVIVPIHDVTDSLAKQQDNAESQIEFLQKVAGYLDCVDQEQLTILTFSSLAVYKQSMDRLLQAFQFTRKSKIKDSDRIASAQKQLLQKGHTKLQDLLKQAEEDEARELVQFMKHLEGEGSLQTGPVSCIQVLAESRSYKLTKDLHQYPGEVMSHTRMSTENKGGYTRGSSSFLQFTSQLLMKMASEYSFAAAVCSPVKADVLELYEISIGQSVTLWKQSAESIISKSVKRPEFLFLVLDILESFKSLDGSQFRQAGKYDGEFNYVLDEFLQCAVRLFSSLQESMTFQQSNSMSVGSNNKDSLPNDGTVHELVADSIMILKKLSTQYSEIMEQGLSLYYYNDNATDMIHKFHVQTVGQSLSTKFCRSCLDNLVTTVDVKSKGYSSKTSMAASVATQGTLSQYTTLSYLFQANNLHYILKNMKGSKIVQEDFVTNIQELIALSIDNYQKCWSPVLQSLAQCAGIHVTKGSYSKNDKEAIKDFFKMFNTTIEDLHKQQVCYSVPDLDLRLQFIKSLINTVLPLYKTVWQRFASEPKSIELWTSKPEKHIKFTVEQTETLIKELFAGK